ncbi:MAG: long-chain fatty acid--CoA ligase [Deltaproteobacteria bacterium]|uniref:Long-chain fatty acid--CoA ligase n=1 Tax=Candidatus Zymogenus saltonus TaxID=2844893 RepID=A0A9D8KG03_9DELT|nr:long-chain fatty acid--CoA ligase [Candidatus Zymogenus saltonus]
MAKKETKSASKPQKKVWLKSYAEGVVQNVNFEKTTLTEAFVRTIKDFPEKPAIFFMGKVISYKELGDMVNRFATALAKMGVKKGSRVATLLPNIPQMVIAYYGAMMAGASMVLNNPLYTDPELEHQLNDSESEYLVTLDLLAPRMIALRPKTKVKDIIVCHINDYLPFPKKQLFPIVKKTMFRKIEKTDGVHEFVDLINKTKPNPPKIKFKFDDIAAFQYTGGTTGVSKGVMLTHENLSKNVQQIGVWFPTFKKGEEIQTGALPFFHSFGMTAVMNFSVWNGWGMVLIPRPEPQALLEAIDSCKPTFLAAVPTMYIGMLRHPDFKKFDLSSLKGCFSGAAPLPMETIKEFEAASGSQICEGYGLSETSPVATINPYGGKTKVGSIGLPIPDTELKIVDLDTGKKEMPVGEPGEVLIKGPQVTHGYYQKPKETKEAIKNEWLFTGDIGKMDDEGYFYIVDRKKDMIIAGGYNIYPRDIDEALYAHPKVAEACTVGIPHEYRGETVKAFVVLKQGETATEEEMIKYCETKLAKYKVPKTVEFRDSLPMSAVGKVLRKELRAAELEKMKK